jgi:hypothetical protein
MESSFLSLDESVRFLEGLIREKSCGLRSGWRLTNWDTICKRGGDKSVGLGTRGLDRIGTALHGFKFFVYRIIDVNTVNRSSLALTHTVKRPSTMMDYIFLVRKVVIIYLYPLITSQPWCK